jgi:hypothetical protein
VARCRQEAPFITVNGKLTLRDSHDFGDSIKIDKQLATPQSSVEHMMHKEALGLKDQVIVSGGGGGWHGLVLTSLGSGVGDNPRP